MKKQNKRIKKAETEETGIRKDKGFDMEAWKPKTELGNRIKSGEITNIDFILDSGFRIMEPGVVDALLPALQSDLLEVGQSKGKFGGGKRSIWRTTQKKTKEGNKPSFTAMAVVGDMNGHVGIGLGKSKETMPAREKAVRKAKLNLIKVKRGCGSWACGCREPHTIPYKVIGKCGSSETCIMPAPKGTGLCLQKECQKLLKMAGIKDVYSKTQGRTVTRINLLKACFDALKKLGSMKIKPEHVEKLGIIEGSKE